MRSKTIGSEGYIIYGLDTKLKTTTRKVHFDKFKVFNRINE